MRSLDGIIVRGQSNPSGDGSRTVDQRGMEATDPRFAGVEPRFDEVSLDIVHVPAQMYSKAGSQVAIAIDEKLGVREIVFLAALLKKLSRWIGTSPVEEVDAK